MITLRRVAVCTMVSLWLAGCTNTASTSAPISSVGGGGAVPSGNNNGGAQQASPEGRIVYNRSYNAIPKGSYSGGDTYTVKRGDTLFYIAWITGNDFRDLAQRKPTLEPTQKSLESVSELGEKLQKATLTRSEALKDLANATDKLKEQLKELGKDPGLRKLEQAARSPGGTDSQKAAGLQKQIESMQKQLGDQAGKAEALEDTFELDLFSPIRPEWTIEGA